MMLCLNALFRMNEEFIIPEQSYIYVRQENRREAVGECTVLVSSSRSLSPYLI